MLPFFVVRLRLWNAVLFVAAAGIAAPGAIPRAQAPSSTGVAFLAIDLRDGRVLASERAERLEAPAAPGSVMKIAALAAALESGVISERSAMLCQREITVAGHHLVCTHPDLHRPLKPGEALAHSCNSFYATLAARLSRSAFDRVLSSLGLPPSDASMPLAATALGLEGTRVPPRRLLDMMVRIAAEPSPLPWKPETLRQVRLALRDAAVFGTAEPLGRRRIEAMAKTGTVVHEGVAQGIVTGVTPIGTPRIGFVLLVSGGAGIDAAALAAERLTRLPLSGDRDQQGAGVLATTPMAPLRIGTASAGGYRVTERALEDYVGDVVAGEAAAGSTPAALEALAIAARTYAAANRGRHAADGFDLCDLTHCQVVRPSTLATRRAALGTAGVALLADGKPASIFYTASCGGHSERPSAVWRGASDPPYLPARPDPFCAGQPAWQSDLEAAALLRGLRSGGFRGDVLRGIAVISRAASGRVAWLRLDGISPPEISGDDFRTLVGRSLGWQLVKSTWFDIARTGRGFHLQGRGAGHGVGLCVVGSAAMATQGQSAGQILGHYYPGLTIGRLDASGAPASQVRAASPAPREAAATPEIVLVLPSADEGERAPLLALTRRTLASLTRRLNVDPPPALSIRFHPTVESYQRATRQPWFTAAATAGHAIDLQPLTALRRRGILESTLAHEMVHVLTAPVLGRHSAWIVEGVAAYFAGETGNDSGAADSCPPSEELRRAADAQALMAARTRAARCVSQRLASGQDWRDIVQ